MLDVTSIFAHLPSEHFPQDFAQLSFMYSGLLLHSPLSAQVLHCPSLSLHSGIDNDNDNDDR